MTSRLVPRPRSFERRDGHVPLPEEVTVDRGGDAAIRSVADLLVDLVERETGISPSVAAEASGSAASSRLTIRLRSVDEVEDAEGNDEAYRLDVSTDGIAVEASSPAGLAHCAQTLVQSIESDGDGWRVPTCTIRDWPRGEWRGLMLDPARGHIPVERVKRVVDQMARAKLNTLHLHLVDAESSALRFESYPELAEPDARKEDVEIAHLELTDQGGPPYYSPADVEEIVEYAARRNVEIVPEIDLPGHATQAILAYPELQCEVDGNDASYWTLCAGNEATYEFLDALIEEVAAYFPSEVVHLGTDEYEFDVSWEECSICRRRMEEEDLDGKRELFHYFLRRAHEIFARHDRRMMIWNDEVDVENAEDLPRDVLVQFWRVAKTGYGPPEATPEAFLDEGFEVVNSFYPHTYVDRHATESTLLGWNPTTRPHVSERNVDRMLGGEMPAWSGWADEEWREYYRRALPSAIPMFADRVWNGNPVVDYDAFEEGVTRHVFGPNTPPNFDVYGELGGLVLPVDGSRNQERAHVYESLGTRSISEAIEDYEATIDRLETLLDDESVIYPDAADAYVDCLEWLIEVVERLARGNTERP